MIINYKIKLKQKNKKVISLINYLKIKIIIIKSYYFIKLVF